MNKKDRDIINNAISKCIYPCVFNEKENQMYIQVPQDMLEDYSKCMFASFLNKNYNFSIQSVIPGSVVIKNKFNPDFKEKVSRDSSIGEDEFISIGRSYSLKVMDMKEEIITVKSKNKNEITWVDVNGKYFTNRMQDVDRWINFSQIKAL